MTALEFEAEYAAHGGKTVAELRARGRVVVPCLDGEACERAYCQGWNSLPADVAEDYRLMGRVPKDWVWPP